MVTTYMRDSSDDVKTEEIRINHKIANKILPVFLVFLFIYIITKIKPLHIRIYENLAYYNISWMWLYTNLCRRNSLWKISVFLSHIIHICMPLFRVWWGGESALMYVTNLGDFKVVISRVSHIIYVTYTHIYGTRCCKMQQQFIQNDMRQIIIVVFVCSNNCC